MPYEYLDHPADLGIRGIGSTLEQAFSEGALAMLAAMADPTQIKNTHCYTVRCTAPDIPFLFVEWLNEILYQRQVHDVLLKSAVVTRLEADDAAWRLEGTLCGEPLDPRRHLVEMEIKAATLSGLEYRQEGGQHMIQCILDV